MSAISVSGVSFGYSSEPLLVDIDAEVEYGEIYGLLGPSGAGKTTLLRLVLGLLRPSTGLISVFGHEPAKHNRLIGYMPQDMALCPSFTVAQTLQYFANIYRLSSRKFAQRKKELDSFLHLPPDHSKIMELSGGQKKFLSLSLAFLHSPRLLILDEPTVGSDPLVGDCIWKYLHECCQKNVSIVLVTHYIEEAQGAHRVGMMRDGRMIEQASPHSLFEKYSQNTLEDVFLFICESGQLQSTGNDKPTHQPKQAYTRPVDRDDTVSLPPLPTFTLSQNLIRTLWTLFVLTRKNLYPFFTFAALTVAFIPAMNMLIVGSFFGLDSILHDTAVFNEETNPQYSEWILNSTRNLHAFYMHPIRHNSLDSMIKAVENGKSSIGIHFSSNFSESLETRLLEPDSLDMNDSSSDVKLYIDNTRSDKSGVIYDMLREATFRLMGNIYAQHNLARLESPLEIKEIVYGKNSKTIDTALPGLMIEVLFFSLMLMCSQLLVKERKEGFFERSLIAGVGHHVVFASNYLASCLVSIVQIALMLVVLKTSYFKFLNLASYPLLFTHLTAQAMSAISTALLFSAYFTVEIEAFVFAFALGAAQTFTSGAIFPIEMNAFPVLGKICFYISPIAIPSQSLRHAMHHGFSMFNLEVLKGLLVNFVSALIIGLLAAVIFKRNSKFAS